MIITQMHAVIGERYKLGFSALLSVIFLFVANGCGVKGDPLPPEKPPQLGRGQPTYKKATEEFLLPIPAKIIFEEEDEEEILNDETADSEDM